MTAHHGAVGRGHFNRSIRGDVRRQADRVGRAERLHPALGDRKIRHGRDEFAVGVFCIQTRGQFDKTVNLIGLAGRRLVGRRPNGFPDVLVGGTLDHMPGFEDFLPAQGWGRAWSGRCGQGLGAERRRERKNGKEHKPSS